MKTTICYFGIFLFLMACNTSTQDVKILDEDIKKVEDISPKENVLVLDSTDALWSYSFNAQNGGIELTRMRQWDSNTLTGEILERIINKSWPKVQIKFNGISNDTVFILIPDSEALTQQMGSSGAEAFMVTTTYSFTELKGIKYVSFNFVEGDHSVPGTYNRLSWEKSGN